MEMITLTYKQRASLLALWNHVSMWPWSIAAENRNLVIEAKSILTFSNSESAVLAAIFRITLLIPPFIFSLTIFLLF